MASHTKIDVLHTIILEGVVPVFYDPDVDATTEVARALVAGGLSTLEFTNPW